MRLARTCRSPGVGHSLSTAGVLLFVLLGAGCADPLSEDIEAEVQEPLLSGLTPAQPVISAGTWHTCGLGADGTAWCWGENGDGQLGVGTTESSAIPLPVPLEAVIAVAAGYTHTCAVQQNGLVHCWGDNRDGELGNGTRTSSSSPALVLGLTEMVSVTAGAFHSCGLRVNGSVYCWGNGVLGSLGDGANHVSELPVRVSGISSAVAISAGEDHTCAILASGRVTCWGRNTWGQLGNGSTADSNVPRLAHGVGGAVSIGTGYAHTCISRADGAVHCWGANWYGQLGDGTTTNRLTGALPLPGLGGVKQVDAGNLNSCAVLADGTSRCWGTNVSGQLGNGTRTQSTTPVTPTVPSRGGRTPLRSLLEISTGSHTCAASASGQLFCWGLNSSGELGDGTLTDRTSPRAVLPFQEE